MIKLLRMSLNLLLAIVCLAAGVWVGSADRGDASPAISPERIRAEFLELREPATQVVIFSMSTCSYCGDARAFLDRQHVRYTDFIIDRSADAKDRFRALGGGGVPLLLIGDRAVRGFREDEIRQALAAARIDIDTLALK